MKKIFMILIVLSFVTSLLGEAQIKFIKGQVFIKRENTEKWEPAKINMKLGNNDSIKTTKNSQAVLLLGDGKQFIIQSEKVYTIGEIINPKEEKVDKIRTDKGYSLSEKFKSKLGKLKGVPQTSTGVTAVAGVRGEDVDVQKKKVKAEELNWEK